MPYQDEDGLFADFHANRHTFISNLGLSGVQPKVAQLLARHSDINLTMNIYTHLGLEAQVSAVNDLPAPPSITLALQIAGESPAEPTISLDRESGDGWGCEHVLQHVLTNVAERLEASLFGPEECFSLVGIQSVARDVSVDFGTVCTQMSPFVAEDFEAEHQEQELSSEPRVRASGVLLPALNHSAI